MPPLQLMLTNYFTYSDEACFLMLIELCDTYVPHGDNMLWGKNGKIIIAILLLSFINFYNSYYII